jgi:oxazoline/thiazoline synthase
MSDAAEKTLREYARFLDEHTGIFASLRNYELPWESPIHVCAGKLKPKFCLAKHRPRPAISARVSGSGVSSLEARLSCLCEGLERHSGIFRGDEARRVARYSEIAEEAIHPNALTLFSESQYKEREEWNRRESSHNWIPQRFDPARSIDWSPAWSLTQKQVTYLPTAYCYYGYPFDPAHDFCRPDSNGNAAGHDLDEAIAHGFLELVERECASVWWYNRVRRPRVDLNSYGLPHLAAIRNLYMLLGRSVEVLDLTAHPAIPTLVALSRSEDPPRNDYILGFGAHFDPRTALAKALMEMTQFLPIVVSGHDPVCCLCAEAGHIDTSFLTPDEAVAVTAYSHFSPPFSRRPEQQVLSCVELVKSWSLEMLILDQTRKDVGMPVVKVVVPGMRSWWARFATGRLYSLPVQIGWLDEPKEEVNLNPCHLIL